MKIPTGCMAVGFLSLGLFMLAQTTTTNTQTSSAGTTAPSGAPALSGGGMPHYIPLWLSSSKLGDSGLFQDTRRNLGVGTTTPAATLDVNGTVNAATSFNLGGTAFAFGSPANQNSFLGFAGNSTMTGQNNTASGYAALQSNTDGYYNTASGYEALFANTSGSFNTASGVYALSSNSTGSYNTASGWFALTSNTTGTGSVATGDTALYSNTSGFSNVATGNGALYYNTTGSQNTASGVYALFADIEGIGNTADGYYALNSNTNGSYLTCIGFNCTAADGLSNATAIGANSIVSESNALVLGGTGSSAVKVGIGTPTPSNVFTIAQGAGEAISDGWTTYSSRRWKTNIQTLQDALAKVEQLRGVSYDMKDSGKHEVGVIAEEVGAIVPEVVTWEKNGKDAQSVDYGRLTALLIEATKEQQALIGNQQKQIARLTSQVKAIQASLHTSGGNGREVRRVKAQAIMLPTGGVQ